MVHALPSSQDLLDKAKVQPLPGAQLSSVHGLPSLHAKALPGLHAPPAHWSPTVHASPSSHALLLGVCTQPCALLQLSAVQPLPSSHGTAVPGRQMPLSQWSPTVHTLLSLHLPATAPCTQPFPSAQASVVQGDPSLQKSTHANVHSPSATEPQSIGHVAPSPQTLQVPSPQVPQSMGQFAALSPLSQTQSPHAALQSAGQPPAPPSETSHTPLPQPAALQSLGQLP